MYEGKATLMDGSTVEITGTITECACWADNLVRENDGAIRIDIREKEDKGGGADA